MRITFIFFLVILAMLSCGKDHQEKAAESLMGKWDIVETFYEAGNRTELGSHPDTSFTENNTGDFIEFKSESTVSFSYSVNGNAYEANEENWALETRTRKNGFTNSQAYFLFIKGDSFEVQFGDGTSDSHENASKAKILFSDNIENVGPYKSYQLTISKE